MLKLECDPKTIHLRLVHISKPRFWNKTLFQAAAIALSIHLLAFFLFQIHPFIFYSPLPTIKAHVEIIPLVSTDMEILAENEDRPDLSPPPEIPQGFFFSHTSPSILQFSNEKPVLFQNYFNPITEFFTFPTPPKAGSLTLKIFGELAEAEVIGNPLVMLDAPLCPEKYCHLLSFKVLVEPISGKIIWYEPQKEYPKEMYKETEQVLRSLSFSTFDHRTDFISGRLDFTLIPPLLDL